MPRPKKTEEPAVSLTAEETNSGLKELDEISNENMIVNVRPKMTAPEWNDWVIDQLRPDEKDPQGNPNIDGLRRLVEDVLGEIIYSAPAEHFEGATENNGMRATVAHILKISWQNNRDDVRVFGAVADVYIGNTDPEYARYAAATADTRAEARALRKALRLKKVVASEEITSLPVTESGLDQYITKTQERGIDKLCKDLDISVLDFINSGAHQYKHFTHISFKNAQKMLEYLNTYLQKPERIPEDVKGYDANWRKAE